MIADYFWKIIFLILLIIGLKFWLEWKDENNTYKNNITALTEILESPPSKNDRQSQRLVFQSIFHLSQIEKIKGKKFEIRSVINEIVEQISISPEETSLIADVLRENYNNAEEFGLFKNEESLEALEEGRATRIMNGPWRGELLVVGHFISPDINDTVQFHFANRIVLPKSVKAAMEFPDITKDVRDIADRMRRAKVLDVGSCDSIIRQYNTIRELSTRN